MLSPYIEKYLGTPVMVVNNVGGVGVIGHKAVKEAKPDKPGDDENGGNHQASKPARATYSGEAVVAMPASAAAMMAAVAESAPTTTSPGSTIPSARSWWQIPSPISVKWRPLARAKARSSAWRPAVVLLFAGAIWSKKMYVPSGP
jgi:hypothetical protein